MDSRSRTYAGGSGNASRRQSQERPTMGGRRAAADGSDAAAVGWGEPEKTESIVQSYGARMMRADIT